MAWLGGYPDRKCDGPPGSFPHEPDPCSGSKPGHCTSEWAWGSKNVPALSLIWLNCGKPVFSMHGTQSM